jgi:hypothetical protein
MTAAVRQLARALMAAADELDELAGWPISTTRPVALSLSDGPVVGKERDTSADQRG